MSKYVPYHEPSIAYARELTKTTASLYDKYKIITNFVTKKIKYDLIRAAKVPKKNGVPDVNYVWENKRGICMDIAALTTVMLRAVGVRSWLCFGKADRSTHAWVEAEINGRKLRYDHDGKASVYKTERRF